MSPSYHGIHITTDRIERTSIFNMPYGYVLQCSRTRGWSLWYNEKLIVEEYDSDYKKFLAIDVDGHVILDTRNRETSEE